MAPATRNGGRSSHRPISSRPTVQLPSTNISVRLGPMRSQAIPQKNDGDDGHHDQPDQHEARLALAEADRVDGEQAHHRDGGVDRVGVEEAADHEAQQPGPLAGMADGDRAAATRNAAPLPALNDAALALALADDDEDRDGEDREQRADEQEAGGGDVPVGIGGRAEQQGRDDAADVAERHAHAGEPAAGMPAARRRGAARRSRSAPPGRRSWRWRRTSRPSPMSTKPMTRVGTMQPTVKTSRYRLRPPVRSLMAPSTGETAALSATDRLAASGEEEGAGRLAQGGRRPRAHGEADDGEAEDRVGEVVESPRQPLDRAAGARQATEPAPPRHRVQRLGGDGHFAIIPSGCRPTDALCSHGLIRPAARALPTRHAATDSYDQRVGAHSPGMRRGTQKAKEPASGPGSFAVSVTWRIARAPRRAPYSTSE